MILPGPFTASRIHFAASAAAAPCCDLSTAGPDFPLRIGALTIAVNGMRGRSCVIIHRVMPIFLSVKLSDRAGRDVAVPSCDYFVS